MHNLHDHAQACSFFAGLPEGAFVYSNPKFTSTPFNPALAAAASRAESWSGRAEDALPGCPVRHPPPPLRTVRSARIPVVPRLPGNGRDPTVGGPQALTKYGLTSGHILTQADATAPES
jgi:hypothetical protein